jgi:trehalose/maltose hydrolase-like predicted phosphorylase
MRSILVILSAILAAGCRQSPNPPAPPHAASIDPWVLTCNDPAVSTPALLWNGLIGVRIGRRGVGVNVKGEPLPFFRLDGYDKAWPEAIKVQPNPFELHWKINGHPLNTAQISAYNQTLDMRTGILDTEYLADFENSTVRVRSTSAIDPSQARIAQAWTLKPSEDCTISCDSTSCNGMESFVLQPDMQGQMMTSGEKSWTAKVQANSEFRLEKRVAFELTHPTTGKMEAKIASFNEIADASRATMGERAETDIQIDGPPEDQQAVRSFLFYLRSAINPNGWMSVSPFGLSDSTYLGHVFWDADVWVLPALAFVEPQAARVISQYRLDRRTGATENLKREATPQMLENLGSRRLSAFQYPWQSSLSGLEVAPPEPRKQIHITGDVVWSLQCAANLGLVDQAQVDQIAGGAVEYFLARCEEGPDAFELKGVMSPDEFHTGDNDLYTNLIVEWVVRRYGGPFRQNYRFLRPHDEKGFLTYDQDRLRGYKQAAALLTVFPLQNPEAEKQAVQMLDRFADKVTKNGPAMTDSVHATIFARIGEADKAYAVWLKGWMDFTNHPLMLFSEKRSKDTAYFTTGAAGCLQSVIFGFLGFRIDAEKDSGASWSKHLAGGAWLNVKPHLPTAWKSVRFKNFVLLGKRYDLIATHDSVKVTQGVP